MNQVPEIIWVKNLTGEVLKEVRKSSGEHSPTLYLLKWKYQDGKRFIQNWIKISFQLAPMPVLMSFQISSKPSFGSQPFLPSGRLTWYQSSFSFSMPSLMPSWMMKRSVADFVGALLTETEGVVSMP